MCLVACRACTLLSPPQAPRPGCGADGLSHASVRMNRASGPVGGSVAGSDTVLADGAADEEAANGAVAAAATCDLWSSARGSPAGAAGDAAGADSRRGAALPCRGREPRARSERCTAVCERRDGLRARASAADGGGARSKRHSPTVRVCSAAERVVAAQPDGASSAAVLSKGAARLGRPAALTGAMAPRWRFCAVPRAAVAVSHGHRRRRGGHFGGCCALCRARRSPAGCG